MNKEKTAHLQWQVEDIINNLKNIKDCGWDSILTNPVQVSKEEDSSLWYMKYQILSLSIGNRYGSKEQLTELCTKAHNIGIKVYTDIVVTHFANAGGGDKELTTHENVDKSLTDNEYIWREKKRINYDDRYSVTHHCNRLPAIRVGNFQYIDLVVAFINELIDCGIDGIRIDSAKMIATPEEDFREPKNLFFERVLEEIKKPIHVFGEVIFGKKELIEKYQKHIDVLTEFGKNSYDLDKEKTIFFAESHDSFLDDEIGYTSDWDDKKIVNNYEFLVRDFPKVLFYARPFNDTWKSERIKQINLRY